MKTTDDRNDGPAAHNYASGIGLFGFLVVLLCVAASPVRSQMQTSVPSLSGFVQTNTIPCPPQSYVVTGSNISSDVVVTAPVGFEISVNQIAWIAPPASITIGQNGPTTIPPTTIYVRLNTPVLGTYTGSILHFSTDSPSLLLPVSGVRSAKSPTTTSLSSDPNPSTFGQLVTITAGVSSPLPGTPTGTVTFFDDVTMLGTVPLNISASATLNTSALAFGSHNLSATYNSDATFDSSISSTVSQFVQGTTTTVVVSNNNPSISGQSVTFTATVSSAFPGTPTGSVTFYDGASNLGAVVLSGGNAALSTSALTPGSHSVTASYSGDVFFAASTSSGLSQMVKAITTTGLVSDHNPSVSGQLVTLTASVGSVTPGTITGTVTFLDGVNPLGAPVPVTSGMATYSSTYTASGGSHSFTAIYNADVNFAGSTSPPVMQTVNKGSTAAVITGNPSPSAVGQSVTFAATVSPVAPGSGIPTGSVIFSVDGSPGDPVSMVDGVASIATSSLAIGVHTVTGAYSGDGNFNPILSSVYNHTVGPVINASAGEHGSITPSGAVVCIYGGNQSFLITPSTGYHVDSVLVDGVMVDSTTSYTFVNVTVNHTIRAVFSINRYIILASAGPNGTISPESVMVDHGSSQSFAITPSGGYHVDSLFVDNAIVDSTTSFTFVNITGDHTIRAVFRVNVSPKFLTLTPQQIFDENPSKPGKSNKPAKRAKPGKAIDPLSNIPNRSNILSEVVTQGGVAPGTSESDSVGGVVIGVSFMQNVAGKWKVVKDSAALRCWVRVTKWDFKKSVGKGYTNLQKTLYDKTLFFHDGAPRGLDFTTDGKNKPLLKQLTKLTPKKQDNGLFAELLALKVNISASQIGTTPAGFGDLVYENNGNPYDEMTILNICATADQMMTYWQAYDLTDYDTLYNVIYTLNRAFPGTLPMDTLQFNSYTPAGYPKPLVVDGEVQLSFVPYLKAPSEFVATRIPRLSNEVEPVEDFEDEEFEEGDGVPAAAKLYQNYPNPFNPGTTLNFRLLENSLVTVRIYNMLGQLVATLISEEELEEGYNELRFEAGEFASGVYFYQIDVQGLASERMRTMLTSKMVLLK